MVSSDFRKELTNEILNSQPCHNPDREHDFLEWIAFVSMELKLPIKRG